MKLKSGLLFAGGGLKDDFYLESGLLWTSDCPQVLIRTRVASLVQPDPVAILTCNFPCRTRDDMQAYVRIPCTNYLTHARSGSMRIQ